MYHGEDAGKPYYTQAKHHELIARNTVDAVRKLLDNGVIQFRDKANIVFADLGTSDGMVALEIFSKIIDTTPNPSTCHFTVILNDQSSNDVRLLAKIASESDLSTKRNNVTVMMNVKNMYKRILPPASVDIATSHITLLFLDIATPELNGYQNGFCCDIAPSEVKEKYRVIAALNWTDFLAARCAELKTDGLLILHIPLHARFTPFHTLRDQWTSTYEAGLITQEEYHRCLIPMYDRTPDEVLAPFDNGSFQDLRLISTTTHTIDYLCQDMDAEGTRDMNAFAENYTSTVQAWSRNFLHQSLSHQRSEEDKRQLLDDYYKRLKTRVASRPYEPDRADVMEVVISKIWTE